jgi:ABC-2 type transport system permease protein
VTAQSARPGKPTSTEPTSTEPPSTEPPSAPPTTGPDAPLASPFSGGGLVDVFRRRYLLRLIVQKEVRSRYQGSLLGLLWSYVQPLVRFCMYFFVIGLVLGLHKSVPNFAIHMFAAIVGVHFFTETFSSGTRSIVKNKAIVRKMAMPREMFPVATVVVSAINTFPQLLILFIGAVASGWKPEPQGLLAAVLGFAIITVLGTALALLFAAMNVFFRDFQNIVATFTIFTHWIVPMIYPFQRVAISSLGHTLFYVLYLSNPLTIGVLLIQRAFWVPTLPACGPGAPRICAPGGDPSQVGFPVLPNNLFLLGGIMLVASLVILVLCQLAFSRLEGKFAERL